MVINSTQRSNEIKCPSCYTNIVKQIILSTYIVQGNYGLGELGNVPHSIFLDFIPYVQANVKRKIDICYYHNQVNFSVHKNTTITPIMITLIGNWKFPENFLKEGN